MAKLTELGSTFGGWLRGLLSDKPIWASFIAYTAITGISFGLVFLLMRLLFIRWWVAAIVISAIGITWGAVAHRAKTSEKSDE